MSVISKPISKTITSVYSDASISFDLAYAACSWVYTNEKKIVDFGRLLLRKETYPETYFSNSCIVEFLALLEAIKSLPDGWCGSVGCDCDEVLYVCFENKKSKRIPNDLKDSMLGQHARTA